MGGGGIINKSIKQKMNVKSSSEAELTATNNAILNALWMSHFIKAQGCETTETASGRDDQATILWETKVMSSQTNTVSTSMCDFSS